LGQWKEEAGKKRQKSKTEMTIAWKEIKRGWIEIHKRKLRATAGQRQVAVG
jgi:hypothetical protein